MIIIYISYKIHNHVQFPFLQIPIHHIRCFLLFRLHVLSFSTPHQRKHKPRPKNPGSKTTMEELGSPKPPVPLFRVELRKIFSSYEMPKILGINASKM